MLLLEKENLLSTSHHRKIVLISQRSEVRENLGQLLRTNGIEFVDEINANFFTDTKLSFPPEEILGIILDVEDIENKDVQTVVDAVYGLIPQNIWCCVVGNNDSISVAQRFLEQGILYFHLSSQAEQMVKQVIDGVSTPNVRTSVNIHVLGCKGGIGNTLISSHVANLIADDKKVPTLLAQSDTGSMDLDLLFGRRILPGSAEEYDENLRLLIGDLGKQKEETLKKFNFIVSDLPIYNKKKEDFTNLLNYGSNFVLVLERRIGAIRTAKQFLDEYKRVQQANPKPRRVFVVINDHRAELAKSMAEPDIERLLEHDVDVVIPYIRKPADKVLETNFGKEGKEAINGLVMNLLGMVSRQQKKPSKSILVSLYRYLMNE